MTLADRIVIMRDGKTSGRDTRRRLSVAHDHDGDPASVMAST